MGHSDVRAGRGDLSCTDQQEVRTTTQIALQACNAGVGYTYG